MKYCLDCGAILLTDSTSCPSCRSENLETTNSFDEFDEQAFLDALDLHLDTSDIQNVTCPVCGQDTICIEDWPDETYHGDGIFTSNESFLCSECNLRFNVEDTYVLQPKKRRISVSFDDVERTFIIRIHRINDDGTLEYLDTTTVCASTRDAAAEIFWTEENDYDGSIQIEVYPK